MTADKPSVLVVDDDVDTLRFIAQELEHAGFACVTRESSEAALEFFNQDSVDAAVLGVRLPGVDGVELGARLKAEVPNELLPVILIGDGDVLNQRIRALSAGCDDFLVKPLDQLELPARLSSLLAWRNEHSQLMQAHTQLLELQQKKRELAGLVVHDLRNPLSVVLGYAELLEDMIEEPADAVADALGYVKGNTVKALDIVARLLDVEELEEGLLEAKPAQVDVAQFLQETAKCHAARLRERQLQLLFDVDTSLASRFDTHLIGRVVENLLDNAVRYAPIGGHVVVHAHRSGNTLILRVSNDGPPVPLAQRERIFDRYHQIEARRVGARANRGLGLYFCRLAVEAHRGSIAVEQMDDLATCFSVRLPIDEPMQAVDAQGL